MKRLLAISLVLSLTGMAAVVGCSQKDAIHKDEGNPTETTTTPSPNTEWLNLAVQDATATVSKDRWIQVNTHLLLRTPGDTKVTVWPFWDLHYEVVSEDGRILDMPAPQSVSPGSGSYEMQRLVLTSTPASVEVQFSRHVPRFLVPQGPVPPTMAFRLRYRYQGVQSNWARCQANVVASE